ncbi:MAG: ammonium transporter [Actinomycetia bacterium]|nr:ammonium transporter [Actinomycetes bacterium]
MSSGKKFVAMSLMTFIVVIALGALWGHHSPADTTGPTFNSLSNYPKTTTNVPVSQDGINALASDTGHLGVSINFTWTLITGFLVLFMQVGFAFLVTGLTRAKNAGHMMMMNIAAFAVALLAYYAVGFAFMFGGIAPIANLGGVSPLTGIFGHGSAGVIGLHGFLLQSHGSYDVGVMVLFLFQVVFMETAGYIIIGAIAERISFAGFLLAEVAMGAVIYPIYGMWMWGGGWLAHLGTSLHLGHGAVDFAGSGVVHATGGWAALALAMALGPRIGKFNKDGSPNAIPGHNIPYVVIGTLVLVFGWMGFNPGSTLGATDLRIGLVAVNTLLAACVGFVMAMIITNAKYGKPDISMSCNGMLAGLVAITAPCAFVAPWAAVVIGGVAGTLVVYSVAFFDRIGIDDPCGAISVHGTNGAWGVLAVGIFADGTYGIGWNGVGATSTHGVRGLLYGDVGQLGAQMFHVVIGFLWAWGVTWLIFKVAQNFMKIRVSEEVELEGLDMPEFGVLAYPDFVLHHSAAGHITTDAEDVGNGSPKTVDLERS